MKCRMVFFAGIGLPKIAAMLRNTTGIEWNDKEVLKQVKGYETLKGYFT